VTRAETPGPGSEESSTMKSNTSVLTLILASIGAATVGFVLGALLGRYLVHLFSILWALVDRRDHSDDQRLKFELLLQ
jgi:hypothetical protein